MAKFEVFAPKLMKAEGGFVNHPADPGGATNKGVTLATYESYCRRKGYPRPTIERLKNIPDEHWNEIMKTGYWDKMKADEIDSQSVAEIMVDWLVNSGTGKIKNIQNILGVKADGIVGNKTLEAINYYDPRVLFDEIKTERERFYRSLAASKPSLKVFLKGWLNRLNDLKYEE